MDFENMSVDELKAALAAKDAMVIELEKKLQDMADESEAKIELELESEKSEEMAEEPSEEMTEKPEEEKAKKMSEPTSLSEKAEPNLLAEVMALRAQNTKLSERLEVIEAEKRDVERREAVSALLREGKVSPAEEPAAQRAWDVRDTMPEFWTMFSERPASSAVPLNEIGHGASGEELNKATLAEKVKALATEKGLNFSEALNLFREQNPDQYNSVFS